MTMSKSALTTLGVVLVFAAASCSPQISRPVTERERTAVIGGLGGGAMGALIGSFAGSAVAGGLFGIPLGAVAGWYVGDQYDVTMRQDQERDSELDRLRRENEQLRRETDDIRRPRAEAQGAQGQARLEQQPMREQELPQSQQPQQFGQSSETPRTQATQTARTQPAQGSQSVRRSPEEIRQAQQALNKMGFDAGKVDGIYGPSTAAALRNFQQSRGIEATGQLNEQTLQELGVEGSSQRQQTERSQQEPMERQQNKAGIGN